MQVKETDNAVGVEISGLDLNQLSNTEWTEIQQHFQDYGLVFFRDQKISEAQHIDFSKRWGGIDVNKFFTAVQGYPEIAEVRKEPNQANNIGGGWHTDHTYDQIPAMGSILVARELPSAGGNTQFASMYRPIEHLSEGLLTTLRQLRAVHGAAHIFGADSEYRKMNDQRLANADLVGGEVTHPIILKHPLSGKESLYVNAAFTLRIDGWTEAESRPLLNYLLELAINCDNTMSFQWAQGSIAFWDNRATWHNADNDYQGERRLMHRTTIGGCALN